MILHFVVLRCYYYYMVIVAVYCCYVYKFHGIFVSQAHKEKR